MVKPEVLHSTLGSSILTSTTHFSHGGFNFLLNFFSRNFFLLRLYRFALSSWFEKGETRATSGGRRGKWFPSPSPSPLLWKWKEIWGCEGWRKRWRKRGWTFKYSRCPLQTYVSNCTRYVFSYPTILQLACYTTGKHVVFFRWKQNVWCFQEKERKFFGGRRSK